MGKEGEAFEGVKICRNGRRETKNKINKRGTRDE